MKTYISTHARERAIQRFGFDDRDIANLRSNSFNNTIYRLVAAQRDKNREVREFFYADRFIWAVVALDTLTIVTFLDPSDGLEIDFEGISPVEAQLAITSRVEKPVYRAPFIDRLYCLFTGRLPKK